jgi:plastocyanin
MRGISLSLLYSNNSQSPTQEPSSGDQTQAPITQTPETPVASPGPIVAPTPPTPVGVEISNFAFSPSQITVKVGTKVTWTNSDSAAHTVTSDTGVFGSKTLNTGSSYSFVFNAPGTYSYHCAIHPSMKAIIVVTQ